MDGYIFDLSEIRELQYSLNINPHTGDKFSEEAMLTLNERFEQGQLAGGGDKTAKPQGSNNQDELTLVNALTSLDEVKLDAALAALATAASIRQQADMGHLRESVLTSRARRGHRLGNDSDPDKAPGSCKR